VGVAVGRDHDPVGIKRLERRHGIVLSDFRAGLSRPCAEPAYPARRMKGPVGRVKDRALEPACEPSIELGTPLHGEAVASQRFVLGFQRLRLIRVRGQPKAARPTERVAGKLGHPLERALGQVPKRRGTLRAELGADDAIGRRGTAQCEATVTTARAPGDLARLVHTHV